MGGQGWLFQVWLCWLGWYGGWVRGCWGVLRTHGSFRVPGQLQWSPWSKWRLMGRTRSLRPHSGYSAPIRPARSPGRSYKVSSPASGGGSPGSNFDTGTMCWTFSGSTQGHSRYGSKDGSCWKPLGDSTSSPRPWSTISSSVWLWYKRYIAAWFPASMFLIEGLYSLLGSGLNLTWTGSIRRTLRGAYRLCRSMLVISAVQQSSQRNTACVASSEGVLCSLWLAFCYRRPARMTLDWATGPSCALRMVSSDTHCLLSLGAC